MKSDHPLKVCIQIKTGNEPCAETSGTSIWDYVTTSGSVYQFEVSQNGTETIDLCHTIQTTNENDSIVAVRPRSISGSPWYIQFVRLIPQKDFAHSSFCRLEDADRIDFWLGTEAKACEKSCNGCVEQSMIESISCLSGVACNLNCFD